MMDLRDVVIVIGLFKGNYFSVKADSWLYWLVDKNLLAQLFKDFRVVFWAEHFDCITYHKRIIHIHNFLFPLPTIHTVNEIGKRRFALCELSYLESQVGIISSEVEVVQFIQQIENTANQLQQVEIEKQEKYSQ